MHTDIYLVCVCALKIEVTVDGIAPKWVTINNLEKYRPQSYSQAEKVS